MRNLRIYLSLISLFQAKKLYHKKNTGLESDGAVTATVFLKNGEYFITHEFMAPNLKL